MAKALRKCLLRALIRVLTRDIFGGHKARGVAKGASESTVDEANEHSAPLVLSTSTKKSMDFITFIRQLYTKQFRIS